MPSHNDVGDADGSDTYSHDGSRAVLSEGTTVYLGIWILLDAAVVYSFVTDDSSTSAWYEYMTNQTWMYVTCVKVAFMALLLCTFRGYGVRDYRSVRWIVSVLFLSAGCAQVGVLFTFFSLNYYDDTLIDTLHKSGYTMAEVMLWNHARHVTVCFLHLLVYFGERSLIGHIIYDNLGEDVYPGPSAAVTMAFLPAWVIGIVHAAIYDDYRIYMFTSYTLRLGCMVVYALASLLSALYFVYGPAYTTYRDFCDPMRTARVMYVFHARSVVV